MRRQPFSYDIVWGSPVGKLGICMHDRRVTRLDYLPASTRLKPASTASGKQLCAGLEAWFRDPGYRFGVRLDLQGTAFQQQVWRQLTRIAPGEVRTYGELAADIGSGARAVGNACRQNPVSIIVPCHRVVATGGPGGYSGKTEGPDLERKCWLLRHEGAVIPALKSA